MSDVFCKQCGQYHASLTVCPNQGLGTTYTIRCTPELKAVFEGLQADRERLRAMVRELRDALERIVRMSGEVNKCVCGRPTGIPALVACANSAIARAESQLAGQGQERR